MRRFRFSLISVCVLAALFAFGADPMGQAVASAAVTGERTSAVVMNVAATSGECGVCSTGDHAATSASGCVTGVCWNMPASFGPNLLPELYARANLRIEAYILGAGIASGPDPHPPRSSLLRV